MSTTIESTFASAPAFNGNISGWDISSVLGQMTFSMVLQHLINL